MIDYCCDYNNNYYCIFEKINHLILESNEANNGRKSNNKKVFTQEK